MNQRTYKIAGKEVKVTDKNILEIIEKTENFEISPEEASQRLQDYLLSNKSASIGEYFNKMNLWEAITVEWYNPCRGRLTPINERYAKSGILAV